MSSSDNKNTSFFAISIVKSGSNKRLLRDHGAHPNSQALKDLLIKRIISRNSNIVVPASTAATALNVNKTSLKKLSYDLNAWKVPLHNRTTTLYGKGIENVPNMS